MELSFASSVAVIRHDPGGTPAGSTQVRAGRPSYHGLRARAVNWPPLRLARMRRERGSVVAVLPAGSLVQRLRQEQANESRWVGH